MLHSDREVLEITDVWGSALGTDVGPGRIHNLLTARLLNRQEMRCGIGRCRTGKATRTD